MMRAVSVPADKRFRRAQVKPSGKHRATFRYAWLAARVLIVLLLTLYGGWRGTALVLGAPALQVSEIAIRGQHRLSRGEVLLLLDGLRGHNILSVDLEEWRERLLASPWVEAVSLRRVLPSRIEVQIDEREPMGIGRLGRVLYLVDAQGVVIDEYGPVYADLDLPIVDGLRGGPGSDATAVDPARARLAANVIDGLASRPDLAARVSQIDVTDPHDAVVMLEGDRALLRLGREDFADRLQAYVDLAPTLRERMPSIDYVDLRFGERLYVRPAKSAKAGKR